MKKYAAILGNLGNTADRFCHSYKDNPSTEEMLRMAGKINGITGIELVGTWDINSGNVKQMKNALENLGLKCASIIPDIFSDKIWSRGSISAKDKKIREKAVNYMREICGIAKEMDCKIINIWPGQDGYDYPLQANLLDERKWLIENISLIAAEFPDLKFALEYKAKEPRTHSYIARMADTLLVCMQTGLDNVGVTIDTGHSFLGGENAAEAVVLAKQAGNKLFHMHFNDNYRAWDDDMIVGSIHSAEFIELLYWLDKCGYDGWFSMDQYPYREDAVGAISESVNWLKLFDGIVIKNREKINKVIMEGNAVKASALLRNILSGN
ncbi:MAG: sugar phosphate isomerase/epimerase [Spirochaetes bacterium]|nr:MAG: sugar phosphate isomerase/epimerase [Spirochaetota bacterium]